jgi:hypothetical protein
MPCPLCGDEAGRPYHQDTVRAYLRCPRCELIFVPPQHHLDASAEKARYDQHNNHPDDPAYRAFLARLADPLMRVVPVGAEGLDFGCGPGPALARMLNESGRPTAVYDPFYAPDERVWLRRYDFVTATEVFEHLYRPAGELDRLLGVLRGAGVLGVMTSFAPAGSAAFAAWYYINDPTHVCFYSEAVFAHIAARWGAWIIHLEPNVVILRKEGSDAPTT